MVELTTGGLVYLIRTQMDSQSHGYRVQISERGGRQRLAPDHRDGPPPILPAWKRPLP
jgi:hypothetical protein